jgi:hypothetical protein
MNASTRAALATAECAVIVDGADDPRIGSTESAKQMFDVIRNVHGLDAKLLLSPNNTLFDIDSAVRDLVEAGCRDLMIYIGTHGLPGRLQLGNELEPDLEVVVASRPNVEFKVVIDACHSGSWIPILSAQPNVVAIVTSTKADEVGYGDLDTDFPEGGDLVQDVNPDDRGLEFSSGLIEDLRAIRTDQALLARVQQCVARGKPLLVCKLEIGFESAVAKDLEARLGRTHPQLAIPR